MKASIVWLWRIAVAGIAFGVSRVVAANFGPEYFKYAFMAGLALAWFVLDRITKYQERLLRKEVGKMSDLQREAFAEEARDQGLIKRRGHET
jgi:hypothetical protein